MGLQHPHTDIQGWMFFKHFDQAESVPGGHGAQRSVNALGFACAEIFNQERLNQLLSPGGRQCRHRHVNGPYPHLSRGTLLLWQQKRFYQSISVACVNHGQGLVCPVYPLFTSCPAVESGQKRLTHTQVQTARSDGRSRAIHIGHAAGAKKLHQKFPSAKLIQPIFNPGQGLFSQRPAAVEYAFPGQRPVYNFPGRDPWHGFAEQVPATLLGVSRFRPLDFFVPPPGDQEKPLPGGRVTVVSRIQHPVIHPVSQGRQSCAERLKSCTTFRFQGQSIHTQRTPGLELGHIFNQDVVNIQGLRPPDDMPGRRPGLITPGNTAPGNAVVGAFG
jgi:hypothetical protein